MTDLSWDTIAAISSAAVALAALIFSVVTFKRQQDRAERHARANVRPILRIRTLGYASRKAIILRNVGIGPAVIGSATFSKDGKSTNNVVDLFEDLPIPYWESFINIPDDTVVPAQHNVVLLLQTSRHLQDEGVQKKPISEDDARAILENWQKIKSGIHVRIEYQDVLRNDQDALDETLT